MRLLNGEDFENREDAWFRLLLVKDKPIRSHNSPMKGIPSSSMFYKRKGSSQRKHSRPDENRKSEYKDSCQKKWYMNLR